MEDAIESYTQDARKEYGMCKELVAYQLTEITTRAKLNY
jgi:hypothetical protein